jgi:hypothetical protein
MQFNIDQIKKIVELVGAQKRPTRNAPERPIKFEKKNNLFAMQNFAMQEIVKALNKKRQC